MMRILNEDIVFWLRDEALVASANLPDPDVIAAKIVRDLRSALAAFEELQGNALKALELGTTFSPVVSPE